MSDSTPGDTANNGGGLFELSMELMVDLAAPQANYKRVLEQGGFAGPEDGFAISFDRAVTDHVLRHHELFSSQFELGLGNVRPMIPLNVDPPMHSKYRKLLDPLFAPRRMDEQEDDITRRVNGFIDTFIDRGECNFSEDFAELFPHPCSWVSWACRRSSSGCSSGSETGSSTPRRSIPTRCSTPTSAAS